MSRVVCTVCTSDRVNGALAVYSSLKDARFDHFYIFCIGDLNGGEVKALDDRIEIIDLLPFFSESKKMYERDFSQLNLTEICCYFKPFALRYLLGIHGKRDAEILYVDSDMYFFQSDLGFLEGKWGVLLTPHLTPNVKHNLPDFEVIIKSGTFNAGLLAVKSGKTGVEFVNYWWESVNRDCSIDYYRGVNADQKWLDLVPHMFADVKVVSGEGLNVGHWRIDSIEEFSRTEDKLLHKEEALVCFHFSGFAEGLLPKLSRHSDLTVKKNSTLECITTSYASTLSQFSKYNKELSLKGGGPKGYLQKVGGKFRRAILRALV
ncbi:hypothetical protein ACG1BZ_14660 [Microbulbifer sp. CNSA002]|uniref:hypothetical protein n=1 Tax=unclassified Microbulbifer TaxID=2619833 RepID=UPI0039B49096